MKLFIVDYWVPFPSSEYGGLQIVIANDAAECTEYLIKDSANYYKDKYPNYKDLIKNTVNNATVIPYVAEYNNVGIIEEFIT